MSDTDIVRRPSLTEAGEPLLLCRSALEASIRFHTWVEEAGMATQAVLSSLLCAVPLPIYTDFGDLRRWPGTRPQVMWHPLMWLPPRLAGRYDISEPDGSTRMESDDEWAIRLCFELTASGLYDPETGTWVDILAAAGLDVDDAVDLARVAGWLAGESDELLDAIDLSEYMDLDEPNWALESALGLRETLVEASWALLSDDLLSLSDDLVAAEAEDPQIDADGARSVVLSLIGLGEALLADVPLDGGKLAMADFLANLRLYVEASTMSTSQLVEGPLAQAREHLYAARDRYWPRLADLEELADDDDTRAEQVGPAEPA